MLIKITQHHIDVGYKSSCKECPGAIAINEVLNGKYFAQVGINKVLICDGQWNAQFACECPDVLGKFINNFDRGRMVSPVEFELDIPTEYLKVN